MEARESLRQWIAERDNLVSFGGADVSTKSRIPDFRSVDGLYNQQYDYPSTSRRRREVWMRIW